MRIYPLKYPVIIFALFFLTRLTVSAAEQQSPPDIVTDNGSCIQCHIQTDNQLINAWQNSAHGKPEAKADCISCHGKEHKKAAAYARNDNSCIACHGGTRAPVVHSYQLSKHGIIKRLEESQYDWNLPLKSANYRAPGCSYCHMHDTNHDVSNTVRRDIMEQSLEAAKDRMVTVCQDCHAPRYISRLADNAEAMLSIARSKVREAAALIDENRALFTAEQIKPATEQYTIMLKHLKNVLIGAGHQSPDYQWWHGQPALDGDLLRIKSIIGSLIRESSLHNTH